MEGVCQLGDLGLKCSGLSTVMHAVGFRVPVGNWGSEDGRTKSAATLSACQQPSARQACKQPAQTHSHSMKMHPVLQLSTQAG